MYSLVRVLHLEPFVLYGMNSLHVLDQITAFTRPHFAEETLVGTLAEVRDGDVAPQGRPARVGFVAHSAR